TPLGSASNVIISDEGIKGLVIRFTNKEINITSENDNNAFITAGAGVIWDDFVDFCVNKNFYGVENLSYIPGTVGASAVQNIGAYGQEVCSTIDKIHAYDLQESKFVEINNQQANFSYRKSIFNISEKGRYIILEITYKLAKSGEFSLAYQDMAYFRDDKNLSLAKIRQEIIKIRVNKLPDYDILPNVGSFFKNIVLEKSDFLNLVTKAKSVDEQKAEKLQSFATSKDTVKVPTALLIDLCGLKGYKQDHIGIYDKHALIVVNHSQKGTCKDVLDFSDYIANTIKEKLGVTISREPTVIN
ncbi:MAG TPA: hypothetical protein DCL21_02250, partial [Alphaproteobacteria bacterium]|nr:hypothetical protein [Alphaproteobacteria bacterium]